VRRSSNAPASRTARVTLLRDEEHYAELVRGAIAGARVSVWIATANVKEMRVEAPVGTAARARGRFVSILDTLTELSRRGVELRLLHAGLPSRAFRAELARHADLAAGALAMRCCPRVHLKVIAVDGRLLYLGSANFTGAGLGAKGTGRRNFEMGLVTDDDVLLDEVQASYERIWSGGACKGCRLRSSCPRPLDTPESAVSPGASARSAPKPSSRKPSARGRARGP
jgi:phosphatidylserine/phosphatidylglycerophosphate/cardiolipin synthase-like enzyme